MPKILGFALAITLIGPTIAWGAPWRPLPTGTPPIVLVANGCGPGFFRTIAGECVPNRTVRVGPGRRVVLPPPCPPGFLRDPNPARPLCYPR